MFRHASQQLYRSAAFLLLEKPLAQGIGAKLAPFWTAAGQHAQQGGKSAPGAASQWSVWARVVRRGYRVDSRGYEHFNRPAQGRTNVPVFALALVGVGGAYYWSCQEEVPYTHRSHSLMFVSQQQERYLGEQIFEQVKAEAAANLSLLHPNHPAVQLVRRIGLKIAEVAGDGHGGGQYKHMQGLDWDFAVVKDDMVNAFVVPGGKVVVFTGLLQLMQTEDEIAAVLAHEVAHVLARHQAERISSMSLFSIVQLVLYVSFGVTLPGFLYQLAFFLPYSRRAEMEADVIGLHLMARACYDPTGNPRMLNKLNIVEQEMEKRTGMPIPQFLRTHPLSKERAKEVQKHLPSAIHELQTSEHCQHHHQTWGFLFDH